MGLFLSKHKMHQETIRLLMHSQFCKEKKNYPYDIWNANMQQILTQIILLMLMFNPCICCLRIMVIQTYTHMYRNTHTHFVFWK